MRVTSISKGDSPTPAISFYCWPSLSPADKTNGASWGGSRAPNVQVPPRKFDVPCVLVTAVPLPGIGGCRSARRGPKTVTRSRTGHVARSMRIFSGDGAQVGGGTCVLWWEGGRKLQEGKLEVLLGTAWVVNTAWAIYTCILSTNLPRVQHGPAPGRAGWYLIARNPMRITFSPGAIVSGVAGAGPGAPGRCSRQ